MTSIPLGESDGDRENVVERLRAFIHSTDILLANNYCLTDLTEEQLYHKQRCKGCNKMMPKRRREREPRKDEEARNPVGGGGDGALKELNDTVAALGSMNIGNADPHVAKEPKLHCKFHSGTLVDKVWTCCYRPPAGTPCSGAPAHIPLTYPPGALASEWKIHPTPSRPSKSQRRTIRPAVAIDCEMGQGMDGSRELIRVTVIDFLTGGILLDKLVWPDAKLVHPNTRYSGVTWNDLHRARRERKAFMGRDAARQGVWSFVGPGTVVVGHGVNNDLLSLRWAHELVVDTLIIEMEVAKKEREKEESDRAAKGEETRLGQEESKAVKPPESTLSLKNLAKKKLGRTIQNAGRAGHDSIEDAVAARDIVIWHIRNVASVSTK